MLVSTISNAADLLFIFQPRPFQMVESWTTDSANNPVIKQFIDEVCERKKTLLILSIWNWLFFWKKKMNYCDNTWPIRVTWHEIKSNRDFNITSYGHLFELRSEFRVMGIILSYSYFLSYRSVGVYPPLYTCF